MSKKKPEKVWVFFGSTIARWSSKKPQIAKLTEFGDWETSDDGCALKLGWDAIMRTYSHEDRAKVALFAEGFRACQAMYAEVFKEADDAD